MRGAVYAERRVLGCEFGRIVVSTEGPIEKPS